jgi:hypothetical protein
MRRAMAEYILTDLGNEADTLFDPMCRASSRRPVGTIPSRHRKTTQRPKLEDATLIAGTARSPSQLVPVDDRARSRRRLRCGSRSRRGSQHPHALRRASTVTSDQSSATTSGFQLSPGEAVTFGVDDVSAVYIHGTAAEGASFFYET